MIKIRITWPMLFFGLILLLIWLAREPQQPTPARRKRSQRPRPSAGRAARLVIDQDADGSSSDYDAETERLDEEAARAGLSARRPYRPNPLRREEAYRDRAAVR